MTWALGYKTFFMLNSTGDDNTEAERLQSGPRNIVCMYISNYVKIYE